MKKDKDQLSIETIEALHHCIEMASPDEMQINQLLLEIGKALDEAIVQNESTLVLQRLYEEALWLKGEIAESARQQSV